MAGLISNTREDEAIHGIIFDFGNVICTYDNELFVRRMAEKSLQPVERVRHVLFQEPDLFRQFEAGSIDGEGFYFQTRKLCGVEMTPAEFRTAFTNIFTDIPETFSLITKLKSQYRLGLLSNTNPWDFEDQLSKVDIFENFEAVTLSFALGKSKPHPALYRDAASKLDLAPIQCVYIDDILEYAQAAEREGMRAIHYVGHTDLIENLRFMGVHTEGE